MARQALKLISGVADFSEFVLLVFAEAVGWKSKQEDVYRVHPGWRIR